MLQGRVLLAGESRDDVGNDLVFEILDPVLEGQLLFLHALYLQRVAAHGDHRVYGCVEVGMVLLQFGVFQANFSLFLVQNVHRLQVPGAGAVAPLRVCPEARTTGAQPLAHFVAPGNPTNARSTSEL